MPENYGIALLITLLAGLATAIGGAIAFVCKKDNLQALSVGLGFSAGVMIFISFMDILPESKNLMMINFPNKYEWIIYLGFIIGIAIAILIDYFIPDHIDEEEVLHPDDIHYQKKRMKRAGIFTAIAIFVHNFPEGMATFLAASHNMTLGLSVGLAIAIHNIPEGIAVAMPVYQATGKKRYAVLYASLSGLSEPIGAFLGMFLINLFLPQMMVGLLMACVAGIMIYISFDTLLPLAKEFGDWHLSMVGIVSGILFMWAGLLLLG
ncbi:zinc transporter ZupT [bacterium]|nr:zinc transporter ZupT [bacterium]